MSIHAHAPANVLAEAEQASQRIGNDLQALMDRYAEIKTRWNNTLAAHGHTTESLRALCVSKLTPEEVAEAERQADREVAESQRAIKAEVYRTLSGKPGKPASRRPRRSKLPV
jgi:hypothetical protein